MPSRTTNKSGSQKTSSNLQFLNADNALFFEGELEYLETEILNVEYAELLGKQLFFVDTSIPSGKTKGKYKIRDIRGKANWISGNSDDLPAASIERREEEYPIFPVADSFIYNIFELEAAREEGINLDADEALAAAEVVEQTIDEAIFNGVPSLNIDGLLTSPDVVNEQAADTGTSSSRLWVDKTPQLILDDINGVFSRANTDSKGRERPSKMGIPLSQYNDIVMRPMGSGSDYTLLRWLVENSPYLQSMDDVIGIHWFEGAGTGGTDLMMIWDPNPRKVQVKLPLDVTVLTDMVQLEGLKIKTPVVAKFGGTIVKYPLSMRKLYGI